MSVSARANRFRDRYALSETGYHDLVVGGFWCTVGNLSQMLPMAVIFLATNDFVGHLLDSSRPLPNIWQYVGMIAVVLVLLFAAQWMQYSKTYNAVFPESARTRIGLAEQLRKLPLSFFGRRNTADLTSAVLDDCAQVEQVFSHVMPELIGTICSTTIAAVVMFIYDWRLSLAVFWVVPVSFIIVGLSSTIQTKFGTKYLRHTIVVASGIQECLECMSQIRASGQSARYMKGLSDDIDAMERAQISGELVPGSFASFEGALLNMGKATTILVGVALVLSGNIGFVTYIMFLLAASIIYMPMSTMFESTTELLLIGTHTARLREINNEPIQAGSSDFHPQGHDIAFDDVTFSYESEKTGVSAGAGSAKTVLNGVSLVAKQGEVTALVGPSGSGKSTVSKLAARFWDPDSGTVTVGGVDIDTIAPETLLTDYSVVFQDVLLFNDTVMQNIRLGRRDATDEEVLAAARAANCDEFIARLPNGYHTKIGENGSTLSGGERQRISIARALLKNAPIVLLDEATASLDAENETKVQQALSRLLTGKTVLIIAHRMRTVAQADKIVVLDEGRVAEEGSPKELMAQNGIFAHMATLQNQSQRWTLK